MWCAHLIVLLTVLVASGDTVYIASSFWAPLFDRSILNYRVDAPFEPNIAKSAREQYEQQYGYRGERLIADLGNGKGPGDPSKDVKVYGDVNLYYT